jgi:hypothetical protein
MRQLHREAVRVHDGIDSYIVRLTRREVVGGKTQPEELILFKFRKEPYSVYFQWIGKEGQGREVVYVKGKHENKMHTILAAGDMPLMPAGKRFSIAPDSVLVRNRSRHPITEAGVGTLINRLGALLDAVEKGDGRLGKVAYLGPQSRPEFSRPAEAVEWSLPPGYDPNLPRGGKRWCYLDPDNHLPALVVTHDDRGREVEYYRYDRFQFPIPLDDADFDPDRLGGK